ncbi:Sarcosine/dimethylglycine N-methyltransferase [Novipirellula aureliae]|uniref:Sarcosine/dimethylglycine N-methyltransferase n=1 Tax=Novipirellula aureliae TaxID=2527966 RepID=A0A5C6E524_9BACT|nr:class I SAM-dependent methyltransferase [Novipirellula aureliae]TWU44018.1 Sarcosine/dimethylglycine N-methyltransferase [Novipirellula aureliae]
MQNYSTAVETARDYYNSEDADNFYSLIWGGEDIHIGWYKSECEAIEVASRRTVHQMANRIDHRIDKNSRVVDLGSGYGGAARYLAKTYGCHVTALNLSETENARNRSLNSEQSLDHLIDVVDGSFEDIPLGDNSYDAVWSQDAILHSGNRTKVIQEVSRVLKSSGDFVFTDPMQAVDCPDGVLDDILSRIHLSTLASPDFYKAECDAVGLKFVEFDEATEHLIRHYERVLQETELREEEIRDSISVDYLRRMKTGLGYWVEGGKQGHLAWGIFHFSKT